MRPLSVLLVDEEAHVRNLVTVCLERENFRVLPVSNGEEALHVSHAEFDLLLTDVQIGSGINGVDLAERITAEKPSIRALVMSGFPDCERLAAARGLPFLAKPFTPSRLVDKIRELMKVPAQSETKSAFRRMAGSN
jgi:DNA-binding NtrC family response regulator